MKLKTRRLFCFMIVIFVVFFSVNSMGDADKQSIYQIEQENVDIIFVIDFSNSMNSNDRNRVALQMLEACIDSLYSNKTRVGFIAYNDRILNSTSPLELTSKENRESLKQNINSIARSGSTDIGLALEQAENFIRQYSLAEGRKGRIVLLSDGVPDLRYSNTGKTTEQSAAQMKEVTQRCKELGVEIDCIAFGENFDGETSELFSVSEISGGGMYIAKRPEVLIDIFAEIIEKTTFSRLRPISVTIAGGEEKTVELPTMDTFADEANILVVSDTPLQDITIVYSGDEITYSRSNNYFTSKITNIKNENPSLKIIGAKDQEIKIYLVLYKDFRFCLEAQETADKNLPFYYQYYVTNLRDGSVIKETAFYQGLQEKVTIFGQETESELTCQDGSQQFERQLLMDQSGEYRLRFEYSSPYFYVDFEDIPITVINTPPRGEFPEKLRYLKANKQEVFDLNQYFTDDNNDLLHFEIQYLTDLGQESVVLNGDQLIVDLTKVTEVSFLIRVLDTEAAEANSGMIRISVEPFWKYYAHILFGILFVILMLFIYVLVLWKKRKVMIPTEHTKAELEQLELNNSFSGKVNVYFIKAPDGLEIEPLTFALYQLKEKKISLGQLFEILDIPLKSFDPYQIHLRGGANKELILFHSSNCSIMVGSSIICKRLNYSVDYGNKIYITSKDGEYELELHYLSIRS